MMINIDALIMGVAKFVLTIIVEGHEHRDDVVGFCVLIALLTMVWIFALIESGRRRDCQ